mmetsp:Transcript_17610/g.45412  ORF Transcript_17610/g.45412 Transcript_17610/m.45412 type:complete len:263 (-) Transcript_17610:1165-1953(-)
MKMRISRSAFPVAKRSRTSSAMVRLHMASMPALCTISFSQKSRSRHARQASAWSARARSSSPTVRRLVRPMAPSNCSNSCLCSSICTRGRTRSSCSLYWSTLGFITMHICASAWRAASRATSSSRSTRPRRMRTPPLITMYFRWPCSAQSSSIVEATSPFTRSEPVAAHFPRCATTSEDGAAPLPPACRVSPLCSMHQARSFRASSGLPWSISPFFTGRDSSGIFSYISSTASRSSSLSSLKGNCACAFFDLTLLSFERQRL